jgi:hypothetical protein
MPLCTHPKCDDPYPHGHAYTSAQCRSDKHVVCQGFYEAQETDMFTDTELIKRHQKQLAEFVTVDEEGVKHVVNQAGLNAAFEQHRKEWERYVEQRDGKRKKEVLPKVWTCRCDCHKGSGNGRLPSLSQTMSVSGDFRLAHIMEVQANA